MGQTVRYEKSGAVARIAIDDGKVNVMSTATLRALDAAFDNAQRDGAIVMLTGRPGIFSAGFDLNVFAKGGAQEIYDMLHAGAELALRLLRFPLPIVAACTGHAYPMGAFLLLASDIRIGADGPYRIGLNEVAIGISVPAFGIEMARQRVLPAWLNRTALSGEMFAPRDAVTAGFLDRAVAAEHLDAAAMEVALALTKIDRAGHATTKARLRAPAIAAVRAAIDAEIMLEAYRARTPA
jgi:enoyl-CoA hydratase